MLWYVNSSTDLI